MNSLRSTLGACSALIAANLVGAGYTSADATANWRLHGLDSNEQRFSPLTHIDRQSIKRLGLAWSLDLPLNARVVQATPLAVDGVLYFSTSLSIVYAVGAATGQQLWRYDPEAWKRRPRVLRTGQGVHRGVAYADGAVIVGSTDGRLISLDAKSGTPNWIVDTIDDGEDSRKQITSAPRVFNGKVIIRNAGADFGTRGYVTAYDAKTGRQLWRFYTVPGDPAKGFEDETQAMAAKTWTGRWWRWGGGGTLWGGITFDVGFNRIYIGTGNSSNYNPAQRTPQGGDNLFLASIVALDADTGKYIWHYQVNPREAWDYKATADIVLADLLIDGTPRKVLMQAPTNGFFYVIDRVTGKLISARKLGKVTWAERIDSQTGRPVEAPGIRYEKGEVTLWPSPYGIHNWQPMAFSPRTGLVYIPAMKLPATFGVSPTDAAEAEQLVVGARRYWYPIGATFSIVRIDSDDGTGSLMAWDPVTSKMRWSVPRKTLWNAGTLATASDLVFQGTLDGWLYAQDGADGRELWKYYVNNGIAAPPITYALNGTQYIAQLVGASNSVPGSPDPGWRFGKHPARLLAFKLGGTAQLPPTPGPDFSVHPIDDPSWRIDEAARKRGEWFFNRSCTVCHGAAGAPLGLPGPDLRESAAAHHFESLRAIVKEGARAAGGMPMFDERSDEEIRDLLAYIRYLSRNLPRSDGKSRSAL